MGQKIKEIYIQGIQSIRNPIKIELNENITQIKGHNAAGKSAIVKAVKIFSGVYSAKDAKSLITRNLPRDRRSFIVLTLNNGYKLFAEILISGKIEYKYLDNNNKVLKSWNEYSKEISNILGWRFIEQANLCLNFKPFDQNIFIDTKPTENAEIMDYLCNDVDIENRIQNILNYMDNLTEIKKTLKNKGDTIDQIINNFQILPYKDIKNNYSSILSINQTIIFNDLNKLNVKNRINVILKSNLDKINLYLKLYYYILTIKRYKYISKMIYLYKKYELINLNNKNISSNCNSTTIDSILHKTNYIVDITKLKNIEKCKVLTKNHSDLNIKIKELESYIFKIYANKYNFLHINYLYANRFYSELFILLHLRNLKVKKDIDSIIFNNYMIKQLSELIFDKKEVVTTNNYIKELKEIIDKIDICPLCKQPLRKEMIYNEM